MEPLTRVSAGIAAVESIRGSFIVEDDRQITLGLAFPNGSRHELTVLESQLNALERWPRPGDRLALWLEVE